MKFKLSIIFFCLLAYGLSAQIELKTTVSKKKLGLNQRLRVEFTVNQQGADNFSPPNFTNFEVVGGPSQSVNQSWINGKVTFSQSYTYMVEPTKMGELTISGASIEYRGKRIVSNPVKVVVVDPVALPKDPNDPNYIAAQNVHLEVLVSNTAPYLGEGIYVDYRLYFSNNIAISDFDLKELPEFEGFWNEDIKIEQLQLKNGKYQGEDYRYFSIKKAVLIPQKTGKLILEPLASNLIIGVPTGRGDFFGNPITRNIRKQFTTLPKTIRVKPLPTDGKPLDFTGAVGQFDMQVATSKKSLKANESTQLKVQVAGKGNLGLFELPTVKMPQEIEVFTPEHDEDLKISLNGTKGMKGVVEDSYTLVPQYKGKYKIPEVSFSYFNPTDKQYHTIVSEDVFVNVIEGKELVTNSDQDQVTAPSNKKRAIVSNDAFRYLQTRTVFKEAKVDDFFKSRLFYLLLFLPFLAIPLAIIIGKKQKERANDLIGNRTRKADKLARRYLSQAKKAMANSEQFYIALEKALHNYLKAKLQVETSEISKDNIAELLQGKGVDQTLVKSFIGVLEDCDFARYAPLTNVTIEEEYSKAKEIITKIDKQL